jgi:hypothetical protein
VPESKTPADPDMLSRPDDKQALADWEGTSPKKVNTSD